MRKIDDMKLLVRAMTGWTEEEAERFLNENKIQKVGKEHPVGLLFDLFEHSRDKKAVLNKKDVVEINERIVKQNHADLEYKDTAYIIETVKDIGERAYNLRGLNNQSKVYLADGVEYNFVDEELELICPKEACGS